MRSKILLFAPMFLKNARFDPADKVASPLSITASQYWDGDDGWWSTFYVQIGSPAQTVRLLPGTSATAGDTTWVVIDEGCTVANPNLTDCADERGWLFQRNASTSWSTDRLENGGLYTLTTFEERYLGLTGNAYYGFDTIELGVEGSGLPSLKNQIVAGFATNDFWLGSLGLSPIPFNFTNLDDPQPSLLSNLYNQSQIPSLSWAYTAGAHYKDTPVLGSLTLGGYDKTRFTPNNVTFSFGADVARDLLVGLRSITYDGVGSTPLLASEIDIFIDSMVTHLWLPTSVCQEFEQAFNLTWNTTTELYTLDEDTHEALLDENPTFTFTLANGNGSTVDIVFPYAAFDLNITQPLVDSEMRYFPLKQAQNSSQYTLGRVFLQEAYLVADYGRRNFSVSQALFPGTDIDQDLVSIRSPEYKADNDGDKRLSPGDIAGIVIGAVAALIMVAGIVIWLSKRSKRRQAETTIPVEQSPQDDDEKANAAMQHTPELDDTETMIRELEVTSPELDAKDTHLSRHELNTSVEVHEMAGDDLLAMEKRIGRPRTR